MSKTSEMISRHHRKLHEQLRELGKRAAAGGGERGQAAGELVAFLQGELLHHATGEEQHLYPAVEPLIGKYAQATATMKVDHEFIGGYIKQIAAAAEEVRDGSTEAAVRLRDLILQFEAIFEMHLEKEERVYLPLFGAHLSEEEQQRVLDRMHEEPAAPSAPATPATPATPAIPAGEQVLDVRVIPHSRRHPIIFGTLDNLAPGDSLVLVNDHDPRPLWYQLQMEHGPGFISWDYLEEGPEVWRVRIGRQV